jgi:hypothetical protein
MVCLTRIQIFDITLIISPSKSQYLYDENYSALALMLHPLALASVACVTIRHVCYLREEGMYAFACVT